MCKTRAVLRKITKSTVYGLAVIGFFFVPSAVQALELESLVSPICFHDKAYMNEKYGEPVVTKWQRKDRVISWKIQGDDRVSGYYPDSFGGKVASSATGDFGMMQIVVNCETHPESLIEQAKRDRDILIKREQDLLSFENLLQSMCLKDRKGIEAALGEQAKNYHAWLRYGEKTKELYYLAFDYSEEDEAVPMTGKVFDAKSWEDMLEVSCPMIRKAAESGEEAEDAPMN